MREKNTEGAFGSRTVWEELEAMARERIQGFVQDLLDEEVTALVGRRKSERRVGVDAPPVYRNGHGKPRKQAMMGGTLAVRRPRVRGLEERFESRILPLFRRRTEAVGGAAASAATAQRARCATEDCKVRPGSCCMPYAPTRREAARGVSVALRPVAPKAAETLERDWESLVAFYALLKEHSRHLQTTNPVESPFAVVRLRTAAGKRYKKVANATAPDLECEIETARSPPRSGR